MRQLKQTNVDEKTRLDELVSSGRDIVLVRLGKQAGILSEKKRILFRGRDYNTMVLPSPRNLTNTMMWYSMPNYYQKD